MKRNAAFLFALAAVKGGLAGSVEAGQQVLDTVRGGTARWSCRATYTLATVARPSTCERNSCAA